MTDPPDDISALDGIVDVSRETTQRLEQFVGLLRQWQKATNLIAPNTLPTAWRRHVADSAQLASIFPDSAKWIDLGSGAGFPGLVVAIMLAETVGAKVDLIESDQRKCAFLRQAIRATGAPAEVHNGRIETVVAKWTTQVDMICSRALAPLGRLFGLAAPLFRPGVRGAFHKGQDFEREIEEASKSWEFDLLIHRSTVDRSGVILEVGRLASKAANGIGGFP